MRDRLLAHIAMAFYAALVAGSFSYGALAAPYIDPVPLTAARFVLASVIMGSVLVLLRRRRLAIPVAIWRFAVLGSLMGIFFVLMFVALRITNPVSTGAVFTLIPLMSALFGYLLLGQKTRPVVLLSLCIAAAGALWVIFRGDVSRILAFEIGKGEAIFFVGCACQAAYGPLVRLFNKGESVLDFTVWTLVAATLCIFVYALFDQPSTDWYSLPAIVWFCLFYLAVFSTAITFFLLQFASLFLPAAKVFAYGYLIPSFIIILEGLLGHGWTSPIVSLGAIVTVFGLVILVCARDH